MERNSIKRETETNTPWKSVKKYVFAGDVIVSSIGADDRSIRPFGMAIYGAFARLTGRILIRGFY